MAISSPEQTPGNEPSSPKFSPDQLKNAEESAASPYSTSTAPGTVAYGKKSESSAEPSLYSSSAGGENRNSGSSNTLDSGEESLYNPRPKSNKSGVTKLLGTRRRQTIASGGLIGIVLGIVAMFSLLSGPFEFIHIAQLLTQFHFSVQQDQQDDRFMHEVRYLRYVSKDDAARARLSYVGNYFTDKFESKVSASGLIPRYSPKAGKFIGYEIDKTSPNSPYAGMNDEEASAVLKAATGLDTTSYSGVYGDVGSLKKDGLILESPDKFVSNLKLNNTVLKSVGYSKLAAVMGTRLFCLRAGCSLHPLTNLATTSKAKAEQEFNKRQQDKIAKGELPPDIPINTSTSDTQGTPEEKAAAAQTAAGQAAQAQQVQNDGAAAGSAAKNGNGTAVSSYASKLKGELGTKEQLKSGAIGGTVILGVACTLRQLDSDAGKIKQSQVILPAMRMAADIISLGSQIQSGQGVDATQLGYYSHQLSGVDQNGNQTSWISAQSIQAELGNPNTGTPADATLKNATNNKTPFSVLNDDPIVSAALNPLCSGVGQLTTGVISFFGAKLVDIALLPVQAVLVGQLEPVVAHWLAGQAIDPLAVGADYGNIVNYGAALVANDQAMAAGGEELTPNQTALLRGAVNGQSQQEFNSQSIATRLLDAKDSRSVLGKLIDGSSPSFTQNIAKMGAAFLNIGHSFGFVSSLFSGHAGASNTTTYDYGFPQIGFSASDMDNPEVNNPFENACYVVGCPDKGIVGILEDASNQRNYKDMARRCFGVTLVQEAISTPDGQQMQWGVTSSAGASPHYDQTLSNCANNNDPNWLRIRFFILDTETMNSMGCYEGDNQACSDIGFSGSTSPPVSSPGGGSSPGTYLNPLRDVQKNGSLTAERVDQGVDYGGAGPVYALGNGTVVNISNSGWAVLGGPPTFIVYQLADGPAQGKYVYVAENCIPSPGLKIGQHVDSSTVLCTMVNASPHIETGWANGSALGEALSHSVWGSSVDDEQHYTAYGQNFSDLLQSLGAPAGTIQSGAKELGSLESGWPTW